LAKIHQKATHALRLTKIGKALYKDWLKVGPTFFVESAFGEAAFEAYCIRKDDGLNQQRQVG
jgi:hypothetical protein